MSVHCTLKVTLTSTNTVGSSWTPQVRQKCFICTPERTGTDLQPFNMAAPFTLEAIPCHWEPKMYPEYWTVSCVTIVKCLEWAEIYFYFLCVFCRAVGRWLTNITPLLPLFTSESCTLQMKHPSWEMPWKPSLDIRLSDHIKCKYSRMVKLFSFHVQFNTAKPVTAITLL